jgi:hypothetical protein
MPYIKIGEPIVDNLAPIVRTINDPTSYTEEELKNFIFVVEVDTFKPTFGKGVIEKYNIVTKKIEAQYFDRALTDKEKEELLRMLKKENGQLKEENEQLKQKQELMQQALDELIVTKMEAVK